MPRRNVEVSYGPASTHGVERIMGVGAFPAIDPRTGIQMTQDEALTRAGWLSVGACIAGSVIGSDFLKNAGLGGAAVAFGVKYLTQHGVNESAVDDSP